MASPNTRSGTDATTKRTQPNWLVECIKVGIPLHSLPPSPAHDATHAEKTKYTWALRKLWTQKTGRKIERLTPDGYNDKIDQQRRNARRNRFGLSHEAVAEMVIPNIDTRKMKPKTSRLSPVSTTVPEGYRWVPNDELTPAEVDARETSVTKAVERSTKRYLSNGTVYESASGFATPAGAK
jgi:hypothetical protein